MPSEVITKRQYSILLKNIGIGLLAAAILSVVLDLGAFLVNLGYKSESAKQQKYIDSKIENEIKVNVLNVMQEKMEYKDKVLKDIDGNSVRVSDILRKFEEIIPKDIAISSLDVDQSGKVSLDGKGKNEDAILDFFRSLKQCDFIKAVDFTDIKGEVGDIKGLDFSLRFQLNGIGSDSDGTK